MTIALTIAAALIGFLLGVYVEREYGIYWRLLTAWRRFRAWLASRVKTPPQE